MTFEKVTALVNNVTALLPDALLSAQKTGVQAITVSAHFTGADHE